MSRALVTGVAGFIGSTLAEYLLSKGWDVLGVDCFTPYYDVMMKRRNLETPLACSAFEFVDADLRESKARGLVKGTDVVFHLAAQPGVRRSWNDEFGEYATHNIVATQNLLEGARRFNVKRFVFASSSSVYGTVLDHPTREDQTPRPYSPYGVTKLAGEHLCGLYAANWGTPTIALRYFSVFGPRQRPDMAVARLIDAALSGADFSLYGTGEQVRDFTYVTDVVRATYAAGLLPNEAGTVVNVGGGASASLNSVIAIVEDGTKRRLRIDGMPRQPGDVDRTEGAIERARKLLLWEPRVGLEDGIRAQIAWQRTRPRRQ